MFRASYVAPGFTTEHEDVWVESMLSTSTATGNYPGDSTTSESWPGFAPGTIGVLNTLAPKYFDVSGIVTLGCNIHDWMIAYLIVVPTPWFAKSGDDGTAQIKAPAGRYRLQLWHPRLATPVSAEITLTEGSPLQRDFAVTLKPDRRIRRGPVTKGIGY